MSSTTLFIITFLILFFCAYLYIKIAQKFGIEDVPNHRSSHSLKTIRGGGILFVISLFIYFFTQSLPLPYLFAAIFLVAFVSFVDDLKTLGTLSRLGAQIIAVILVFYQLNLFENSIFLILPLIIFCLGIINIYNFMDGINGITGFYSLAVLLSILVLNHSFNVIDYQILVFGILGIAVFGFFNFRKKAIFFAGDIGSISIGVFITFLLLLFSFKLTTPLPFMFIAVYLVDGGVTIISRLLKKENILKPHKSHLYQNLVHLKSVKHLTVAGGYAIVQLLVNIIVLMVIHENLSLQLLTTIPLVLVLIVLHIFINRKMKPNLIKQSS
ncbi:UDP-GlcNAc--UDP-phosphate GlcNAc-1-phosphate transferase [Maribacter sp. 1_MG-2023]|uniref:UDP-GlcNAc--UDP-phosphate GlcNAc-1-phosphate transferase n=1 Tax=Maribacter sp. 1_MG-2023 TaxID=3062677 RepID=UPI0026E395E5|nr:UDP-GlcNAc--UDP-phosphate GlcNAc-1-phosphate transferase [Maribacter sp. 1_MG-2023]MDO6472191.1 UDP-GlcNAc--UDP-phosphate GlcNAc-1-phosphate transferase [Maribacter sp. 1_MG-2023]